MKLIRMFAACAIAVSALGFAATPSQASPPASKRSAGDVKPAYWASKCDYGRSCIRLKGHRDKWWNAPSCGEHAVWDYYDFGKTHGNGFSVYYSNSEWGEYIEPWTGKYLDSSKIVYRVVVWC